MAGPGLHSRVVAILKVALPLIAVAMLAGLFLGSEDTRPRGELVFSPADLAALGQGMSVTNPVLSGSTSRQDRFRFAAKTVTPDAAPPTRASIEALTGRIDFADGRGVDLRADRGEIEIDDERLTLEGGVRADTSDGYVFGAERVVVDLDGGGLEAFGGVTGDGPIGKIAAERLTVGPPEGEGAARRFFFEDRVRVLYDPPDDPG
jgi:lipopolysaccharide export system protein LptC